jgi:hypothetical protein
VLPHIVQPCRAGETQPIQIQCDLQFRLTAIEQARRATAVREWFCPDFERTFIPDAVALNPFCVLIYYCDDLRVRENFLRAGIHTAQIIARKQGSGQQGPRDMCVRYSSRFIPALPTSSISGSFQ